MHYTKILILTAIVAVILAFAFSGCQEPPIFSLESAKAALREAESAGAPKFAQVMYEDAERLLSQGWQELARQNGRIGPFRNYADADSLLAKATRRAHEAGQRASDSLRTLQTDSEETFAVLSGELEEWNQSLNGSLASFSVRDDWQRARLHLDMAQKLIVAEEYDEARLSMLKARDLLKLVGSELEAHQFDETRQLGTWRRWVQETLSHSRNANTYAVIVDKAAHKTYLVRGGKLLHTYDSELGYNSGRQKLFAGDAATPEGKYQVVKENNRSKFYRALLLDYPNQSDKVRFEENKRKGIISKRARIGSWIEIHGDGGKNRDWTEGCVALTNTDMDHIMRFVSVGTPVTIVRKSDQWP